MQYYKEFLKIIYNHTCSKTIWHALTARVIEKHTLKKNENVSVNAYPENEFKTHARKVFGSDTDNYHSKYVLFMQSMDSSVDLIKLIHICLDNILIFKGNEVTYKFESIIKWREISRVLGQDICIASEMAWKDILDSNILLDKQKEYTFDWPVVILPEDNDIKALREKELPENHFHLYGSIPSAALFWVSCMNHPDIVGKFSTSHYRTEEDSISTNLQLASNIRALLFRKITSGKSIKIEDIAIIKNSIENSNLEDLRKEVNSLRYEYGEKVRWNNTEVNLDYSMTERLFKCDLNSPLRSLSGERCFLYHCFLLYYRNKLSTTESDLFYIYLLITNIVRNEVVISERCTIPDDFFENHMKGVALKKFCNKEYYMEMMKIIIAGNQRDNKVNPFEVRVRLQDNEEKIKNSIIDVYQCIEKARTNSRLTKIERKILNLDYSYDDELKYYLVESFSKSSSDNRIGIEMGVNALELRNKKIHDKIRKQAIGLKEYLTHNENHYPDFFNRMDNIKVLGIDASGPERACRPEVFATEFRYLKTIVKATFHVGEFFCDIVDGLRAIEEACLFLELREGDRLGHAVALGINAREYYSHQTQLDISRQDALDNALFLLRKNSDLKKVKEGFLSPVQEKAIIDEALKLFDYIYGDSCRKIRGTLNQNQLIEKYCLSWCLRGDHPICYESGEYRKPVEPISDPDYLASMIIYKESFSSFRDDIIVAWMTYLYFYDMDVRSKGNYVETVSIPNWLGGAVEKIQNHICSDLCKKGIAIECNPTSNILLSSVTEYKKHPLTVFLPVEKDKREKTLAVSINTDDANVFETSLVNEYAIMLHVLSNIHDRKEVLRYLEEIRKMGVSMSFWK